MKPRRQTPVPAPSRFGPGDRTRDLSPRGPGEALVPEPADSQLDTADLRPQLEEPELPPSARALAQEEVTVGSGRQADPTLASGTQPGAGPPTDEALRPPQLERPTDEALRPPQLERPTDEALRSPQLERAPTDEELRPPGGLNSGSWVVGVTEDGDAPRYSEPALPAHARAAVALEEGAAVAPDPEPGDRVGAYRLLERLGKGGAGAVFKAVSPEGEEVALKVLSAAKVRRARVVQRFFDEVRTAGVVDHPGLIRIFDFIEEERPRRLAYVMELVPGESLRERLQRDGTLALDVAVHIGAQIASALDALHARGIVHRDLKPENIMLSPGPAGRPQVRLLDYGVVKFIAPEAGGQSEAGTFVGTPRYMAPEQAAGGGVDPRADLFALGVMLFEMITGRCPHEGDVLREVVLAKLKGAPKITVNPQQELLPRELTELVDDCMKLSPEARPASAKRARAVLEEVGVVLMAVGPVRVPAGAEGSVPPRISKPPVSVSSGVALERVRPAQERSSPQVPALGTSPPAPRSAPVFPVQAEPRRPRGLGLAVAAAIGFVVGVGALLYLR